MKDFIKFELKKNITLFSILVTVIIAAKIIYNKNPFIKMLSFLIFYSHKKISSYLPIDDVRHTHTHTKYIILKPIHSSLRSEFKICIPIKQLSQPL